MNALLTHAVLLVQQLAQQTPEPEDVKAGWLGFGVFLLLAAAVVLLAFSFVKHLRRAKANFDAREEGDSSSGSEPNGHAPS